MQIIAIDPGLTSGVAIYNNGLITTKNLALDKEEIALFMQKNKSCKVWVVEKPIAYSPLAGDVCMCEGYWYAAIDFLADKDADIYNQYPKQRVSHQRIAERMTRNPHESDALAHLLKYLDKNYPTEYNMIIHPLKEEISE